MTGACKLQSEKTKLRLSTLVQPSERLPVLAPKYNLVTLTFQFIRSFESCELSASHPRRNTASVLLEPSAVRRLCSKMAFTARAPPAMRRSSVQVR